MENSAIGMFDSGVGGLTVLKAVSELLPNEKIVYFGDTTRQFYGDKTAETILRYSIENAIFLMEHSIKALVIACNTSAAVSVKKLQKIFNIPVIGVIEPGAEQALKVSKTGCLAVLATKGTVLSGAYQQHIHHLCPEAKVISLPCPLLAPLVEEGMHRHPAARLILREYLLPLKDYPVDTILLGCTHYPPLKELIQEEVGPHIEIVDSAGTCAAKVQDILKKTEKNSRLASPSPIQYFVSDNPEKFQKLGQQFLSRPLDSVALKSAWFNTHE